MSTNTEVITPYYYTIFKDKDNLFKAKNAKTGGIDYLNPDPLLVIDGAVSGASNKGAILLKEVSGGYVFNSGLNLVDRSFWLVGEGYKFTLGGTSLRTPGSTVFVKNFSGGTLINMNNAGSVDQKIEDLGIQGDDTGTGIDATFTGGNYGEHFKNMAVQDFDVGVRIRKSVYNEFNSLMINSCPTYGLWLDGQPGTAINTTRFFGGAINSNGMNIFITNSNDVQFFGTIAESAASGAIVITSGSKFITAYDMSMEINGTSGAMMVVDNGNNNSYIGCRHDSDSQYVAYTIGAFAKNIKIIGNEFQANASGVNAIINILSGATGVDLIANRDSQSTPVIVTWNISGTQITALGNAGLVDRHVSGVAVGPNNIILRDRPGTSGVQVRFGDESANADITAGAVNISRIRDESGATSMAILTTNTTWNFNDKILSSVGPFVTASGNATFNQSGGITTVVGGFNLRGSLTLQSGASGISFSGMQMLPALSEQAKYVIWVSGAITRALRTADGVVQFSGGSGFAATVVQNTLQATLDSLGGKVQMREGLYDFVESGIQFNASRSGRMELGGVLDNTIIRYVGATVSGNAAITIGEASGGTPNDTWYVHDICVNCGSGTNTSRDSGRNGINVITAGNGYLERLRLNNVDIGIDMFDINAIWTRDIHARTGLIGIRTRGGPTTNANGTWFDGLIIADMSQAAVSLNADNTKGAFVGKISNSDFESNSGAFGVIIDGSATNFVIDNCYFENNTSGDIYLKGQSGGGARPTNTTIRDCRFSNSNSVTSGVGGAIVIDFASKTLIDNCQFFNRVSGCAVLFNNSGFATGDKIMIKNPTLATVPYLVDNTYGLGNARNLGTVDEDSRRGVIVMGSTSALVEGDVIIMTGGCFLGATTTTSGAIGPAVVMYGNTATNRPLVIATDGISPVLTISGANRGELLQTSATAKNAVVGSGFQVNSYIGWSVEGFLSGVKVNCKIL